MGIWDTLFGKHGQKKDKIVQELLEIIKRMETETIMSEKNESWLIKENTRLYNDLQKCLHPKKANPVRLVATFINN